MRRYDVVIIGGGSAGLTCGLALARRGKRVVIFEQHTAPGGYVTSFTRKGFRFDGGAGCFASGGIIFPILRALGLEDAIRPVPIGFTVLLGGERVSLASPETVIDGLGRLYPGSRDDLSRYFRRLAPLVQMMDISTRLEPYTSGTAGILRLLAAMAARPAILATLLRERRKTSDDLLAETIRHPEIRHVVKSLGYPTMSPMMTAGMWGAMFADYWYPLGGMRTISDAVAGAYQAAGGELRLGARVEAITCGPGGRATGVRLAGGEVAAGESVISAADITWTYSALEGEAGTLAAFRKRLAVCANPEGGHVIAEK
jgi:prolycopene isomerase